MLRATKAEGDDRWRKLSRVLTEALIPLLAAQKIHIEKKSQLDLLHQVFAGQYLMQNIGSVGMGSMGSWEPINFGTGGSGTHQFLDSGFQNPSIVEREEFNLLFLV